MKTLPYNDEMDARQSVPTSTDHLMAVRMMAVVNLIEMDEIRKGQALVFLRHMTEIFDECGQTYCSAVIMLALTGQDIPGPLELTKREGISKQAVSKAMLQAIDRVQKRNGRLGGLLQGVRDLYTHKTVSCELPEASMRHAERSLNVGRGSRILPSDSEDR
jgi:hypothetical protein